MFPSLWVIKVSIEKKQKMLKFFSKIRKKFILFRLTYENEVNNFSCGCLPAQIVALEEHTKLD